MNPAPCRRCGEKPKISPHLYPEAAYVRCKTLICRNVDGGVVDIGRDRTVAWWNRRQRYPGSK